MAEQQLSEQSQSGENAWPHRTLFTVIALAVVSLWLVNLAIAVKGVAGWSERGIVGDSFGIVNALFAGLAFLGVIYAIVLQREDLRLQQEELKLTRAELRGQREQLEAQNRSFKTQIVDNRFFQLFDAHQTLTNSIQIDYGHNHFEGRGALTFLYHRARQAIWDSPAIDSAEFDRMKKISDMQAAMKITYWERFYNSNRGYLSHYFGSLRNLLGYVHESVNVNASQFMHAIVRQMSDHEKLLLVYHCSSLESADELRSLVHRYEIVADLQSMAFYSVQEEKLYKAFDRIAGQGLRVL